MFDDRMLEDIGITRAEAESLSRRPILEGVMNRHAVRQPAAIAGSPPGDPGAPSSRRLAAASQESSAGPGASALAGSPAARIILEELDQVVRKSHRRSALGRMLHRVGSAFARLWSRIVPEPPPPHSDLSPEIWFPWFFL
jgi:hypothetical protein